MDRVRSAQLGRQEAEMLKAVPAAATGHFYEWPASPGLQGSFSAIWIHKMPEVGAPPVIVVPDGTIDLQWIDGALRIAGPDKERQTEMVAAGTAVIGFRFRPAAATVWLGISASELVGQRLALGDLWGAKARRLAAKVHARQRSDGLIASLATALAEWKPDRPADKAMGAAHALIEAGAPPGVPLLPWLARSLAMSERTLRRRFDESFGYGPKTLDRILRYQRFLRFSRTSRSPVAVMAAEAGYADQAHLVRESSRLSGVTPKEHLRIVMVEQRRGAFDGALPEPDLRHRVSQ